MRISTLRRHDVEGTNISRVGWEQRLQHYFNSKKSSSQRIYRDISAFYCPFILVPCHKPYDLPGVVCQSRIVPKNPSFSKNTHREIRT